MGHAKRCSLIIIDDGSPLDRRKELARRFAGVEFKGGVNLRVEEPRESWPSGVGERGQIIAFVHWNEVAREVVEGIACGAGDSSLEQSVAAIVAYRGGGAKQIHMNLPGVEEWGGYHLLKTQEGEKIPILSIQRPVMGGNELSEDAVKEVIEWALDDRRLEGRDALPAVVTPAAPWLVVAKILVGGYVAARLPSCVDAETHRKSKRFAEEVRRGEYWKPLGDTLSKPGDMKHVVNALHERLDERGVAEWGRPSGERLPDPEDERVLAVWHMMSGV